MNRFSILVLSFFISTTGLAADNSCWADIFVALNLPTSLETLSACVIENSNGTVEKYCGKDHTVHSESFTKYMKYHSDYHATLDDLRDATSHSEKTYLSSELLMIENEWVAFGYRYEVYAELNDVANGVNTCLENGALN